jgi:hypothetical protein
MKFVRIVRAMFLSLILGFASHVQEAQAEETFGHCTPTEVAAFGNRVHIRCASAVNGFVFFAVPSADADLSNKVLSLGATAVVFNHDLEILHDPADTTSGPQFGCLASDCRPILGIRLVR